MKDTFPANEKNLEEAEVLVKEWKEEYEEEADESMTGYSMEICQKMKKKQTRWSSDEKKNILQSTKKIQFAREWKREHYPVNEKSEDERRIFLVNKENKGEAKDDLVKEWREEHGLDTR